MNNVKRYVVRMRNGDFMRQEFDESLDNVKIFTSDHPIDADLLKSKSTAERVINEIITGKTNLPVSFDKNNPPVDVVEINIAVDVSHE